ncbi:hypothetical protein KC19_2G044700 [Ceratodon purpureus]|uniref:Protein kinase domain-containing protein n=1 Tax=Ceratodon purpureus TaxID=3225 RepID=A0A8T0IT76_CERPU|nr:hypothetical protein KC19_2G044700 [Ceratodon purpureus]
MAESHVLVSTAAPTDGIGEQMETLFLSCEAPAHAMENSGPETTVGGGVVGSMTSAEEERRAYGLYLSQLQRESASEEEYETARTKPTWTKVDGALSESVDGASSVDPDWLHENQLLFQRLVDTCPPSFFFSDSQSIRHTSLFRFACIIHRSMSLTTEFEQLLYDSPFFVDFGGRLDVGQRIAGGGQAGIYEALFDGQVQEGFVLKVFETAGSSLADLQRQWVSEIASNFTKWNVFEGFSKGKYSFMKNGTLLKDGRFAFVMRRMWGDLRKAIDNQMDKGSTHQSPPFPLPMSLLVMLEIALGMKELHANGILHRDLKAANVLLKSDPETIIAKNYKPNFGEETHCLIADFETCQGVMGTGFWRAPEVLKAVENRMADKWTNPKIWTKKVDVYSYGMTCYEVLSGCIPFQNRKANDYRGVIEGERPPLPDYVDRELQELLGQCWHTEPTMRPSFEKIEDELRRYIEKKKESHEGLGEAEGDAETWKNLICYKRNILNELNSFAIGLFDGVESGVVDMEGVNMGSILRDAVSALKPNTMTSDLVESKGAGSAKGHGRRGRRPKSDLGQNLPGFVRSDNHASVAVIDTLAADTRSDAIQ